MRISLGTSCHTVRDGADNFGESQRKKVFKRNKQGGSRIRTRSLVYEFHIVLYNVFRIRKPIQYTPY